MAEQSKAARTRQRILDAGAQLFRERGYSETRLSDIAELAGIQTGSLYYYFASREELVAEILRLGIENAWSHVRAAVDALPDSATPLERLRTAIRAHVGNVLEISDYASAHPRIVGQVPPEVQRAHFAHQRAYGTYWNALFEAVRDSGELAPGVDVFVARMLIFGGMNGAGEWYTRSGGRDADDIAEQAVRVLVDGLARHERAAAAPIPAAPAPSPRHAPAGRRPTKGRSTR